jgi:type II secretory pathway component PulF
MATVAGGAEAAKNFAKNHWIAFAVVVVAVLIAGLAYDRKNGGNLSTWFAGLPLVGKLFK